MQPSRPEYSSTYVTAAATTTVFAGKGICAMIVLNEATAGTITIKDGTTTKAIIGIAVPAQTLFYHMSIADGLSIVSSAGDDFTVLWGKP